MGDPNNNLNNNPHLRGELKRGAANDRFEAQQSVKAARVESVATLQQLSLRVLMQPGDTPFTYTSDYYSIPNSVLYAAQNSITGPPPPLYIPETLVNPQSGRSDPLTFRSRAMNARYGLRQRERDQYASGGQMRGQRAIRSFVDHVEDYDRHGLYTVGPPDHYLGDTTVRGFRTFTVNKGEVHPMFFRDPGEN